jgi:hypothetical protein
MLECIGNQLATILDRARHQLAHLAIGTLELSVENDRQGDEDADQDHELEGE